MSLNATSIAAALLAMLGLSAATALAQEAEDTEDMQEMTYGEAEYLNSCAVCHGFYGRGDGPLGPELRREPSDLTLLSQRNGGEFPYWRIFAVIDGRHLVPGHGDRDMPVWGRRFLEDDAVDFGPRGGEMITNERIHELTAYIGSLQR